MGMGMTGDTCLFVSISISGQKNYDGRTGTRDGLDNWGGGGNNGRLAGWGGSEVETHSEQGVVRGGDSPAFSGVFDLCPEGGGGDDVHHLLENGFFLERKRLFR